MIIIVKLCVCGRVRIWWHLTSARKTKKFGRPTAIIAAARAACWYGDLGKKVRFIEVEYGSWDNHNDIYSATNTIKKTAQLDQTVTALLDDLQSKGLLQKTLVVLGTESGRTPKINQNAGRDHHPGGFSCVLAGAGINGGQIIGRTDSNGRDVEDGHCFSQDLNATLATACGLPLDKEFHSGSGRPFLIADHGKPVTAVSG